MNIPATFVIECNASNSTQRSSNHEWTTILPEDLQLKRGDVVRINQAFCSSQGVGDLIDITNKVNSSRVVFEYYIQNDGMNDKVHQRRGLSQALGTDTYIALPPLNHRPARLHRWGWCGDKLESEYPSGALPSYVAYQVKGREDLYVPSLFRPPHFYCKTQSWVFDASYGDKIEFWGKGTTSPEGKIRAYPTIRGLSTSGSDDVFYLNFLRKIAVGCAYTLLGQTFNKSNDAEWTGLNCFPFVVKSISCVNGDHFGTWEIECYMGSRDAVPVAPNTDPDEIGTDFFDFGGNGATCKVGASSSSLSCCNVPTFGVEDRGDSSKWRIFPKFNPDKNTKLYSYFYTYSNSIKSSNTHQHKGYTDDISRAYANITQTAGLDKTTFGLRQNEIDNRFNRIRINIHTEDRVKTGIVHTTYLYCDVDNIARFDNGGFCFFCSAELGMDDPNGEWCYYYKTHAIPSPSVPDRIMLIRGLGGTTPGSWNSNDLIYIAMKHWGASPRIKFSNMPTYINGDYPNLFYDGLTNFSGGSCFLMDTDKITNTHADLRRTTYQIKYTPVNLAGTGSTMSLWNGQSWLVHYGYKDLQINKTYFSPSDLADEITNQLHKLEPIRKKGQTNPPQFYENSEGAGLPQSKLLIPLLAPSKVNMVINGEEVWNADVNTLDTSSGMLNAPYDLDTFCCRIYEEKGLFRMWGNKFEAVMSYNAGDGEFSMTTQDTGGLIVGSWIWCWTTPSKTISYTRVKSLALSGGKPVSMTIHQGQIPITDTSIIYYQSTHPRIDRDEGNDLDWYLWLRNPKTPLLTEEDNGFQDKTKIATADLKYSQYPQRYFQEGIPINDSGFGGYIDIENMEFITQFCGTSNPTLNWSSTLNRFQFSNLHQPFVTAFDTATKLGGDPACVIFVPGHKELDNIVRVGGVNVVNWGANETDFGDFTDVLQTNYENPLLDLNRESADFWNTFGFSDTWLKNNVGNSFYDTTNSLGYKPLGTTQAEIDSAEGLINTASTTEDSAILSMTLNPASSGSNEAVGGENLKGHNWGYGIPNTDGTPSISSGATKSNPDAEAKKYYQVQVDSGYLTADLLPIKTKIAYFLITSSLVDRSEFYGTNGNVACMGLLSKNYQNSDFFFGFQSPITYYVQKDRTINSITTTLLNPDLSIPQNISPYSSVIYEVMRQNTLPQPPSLPLYQEQSLDWELEQQVKLQQMRPKPLFEILEDIVDDVIHPLQEEPEQILFEGQEEPEQILQEEEALELPAYVKKYMEDNPTDRPVSIHMSSKNPEGEWESQYVSKYEPPAQMTSQDPQPIVITTAEGQPVVLPRFEEAEPVASQPQAETVGEIQQFKTQKEHLDIAEQTELRDKKIRSQGAVADWSKGREHEGTLEFFYLPTYQNKRKGYVGHGYTLPYGYNQKKGTETLLTDRQERHGRWSNVDERFKGTRSNIGADGGEYPRGRVNPGETTGRKMNEKREYGGLLPPAEWIERNRQAYIDLDLTPPSVDNPVYYHIEHSSVI